MQAGVGSGLSPMAATVGATPTDKAVPLMVNVIKTGQTLDEATMTSVSVAIIQICCFGT